MTRPAKLVAISGAQMDEAVPRRRSKLPLVMAAGVAGVLILAMLAQWSLPSGLQVRAADVRLATVASGIFKDELIVRATLEPAVSVMLDLVEGGRVEGITVRDGAMVRSGELLFRLSNSQRQLELLARQSDLAQQLSNLIGMRAQYDASRNEYRRRLSDLRSEYARVQKKHARLRQLNAQGFVSTTELEDSADELRKLQESLAAEEQSRTEEERNNRSALSQMEKAIAGLNSGITMVNAGIEALSVRSPISGRLTNFTLKVGASVKQGERIGRIDDPDQFKLVARIDEYYLRRVELGQRGQLTVDGQTYLVSVTRTNAQVSDGRFSVELGFEGAQPPSLRAGQSLDCQLTLGEPQPALLLDNGAFVNETGGAWAFVIGRDGRAERREIRLGRRNNSQLEVLEGVAAGEKVIVSSYSAFGNTQRLALVD
jgi:HlyD family secretion protein